jgi:hypothetical protein
MARRFIVPPLAEAELEDAARWYGVPSRIPTPAPATGAVSVRELVSARVARLLLSCARAFAIPKSSTFALVTRDPDRYPNAPLPVIDPAAALSWLTE